MDIKYYTTTDIENNKFIGKVYTSNTNQLVYTSKPYNTREQAMSDVRTYIITSAPPTTEPLPPKTITSTTTYTAHMPVKSDPGTSRRCCGR
jgi:hypothetical protein